MCHEAARHRVLDNVVADSVALIGAFRYRCVAEGYIEQPSVGLVRHFDPSIRFTNSAVSVLKAHLGGPPVEERLFLVQPAVRLRNLAYWLEHGRMSGFGCYFTALGTLSPPGRLADVIQESVRLLVDDLGVAPGRILLRSSSRDSDLCQAAAGSGMPLEIDGYEQLRYRHVFGMDGVAGRNANLAIVTDAGPVDIANVIVIERDGRPVAVEAAYGVNMVLAQRERLTHPVLASVGAVAVPHGVTSLMALDALGTAAGLLAEGLRPVARGRGGKLRLFLKLLAADGMLPQSALADAACAVAEADEQIRRHVSPPEPGLFEARGSREVAEAIVRGVAALSAAG